MNKKYPLALVRTKGKIDPKKIESLSERVEENQSFVIVTNKQFDLYGVISDALYEKFHFDPEEIAEAVRTSLENVSEADGVYQHECFEFLVVSDRNEIFANHMTAARAKQLLFCSLQMARKSLNKEVHDWEDVDDVVFSEFDMEESEASEVFALYDEPVYTGSCYPDGKSPKNYDWTHFGNLVLNPSRESVLL